MYLKRRNDKYFVQISKKRKILELQDWKIIFFCESKNEI